MNNCIFCKIVANEVPAEHLYETETTLTFLDAFPVSPGHSLIVPKKHFSFFVDLPADLARDLAETLQYVAPRIVQALQADGYNLGLNNGEAAGQAVEHVHWHVIPRYTGDGLKHWPNSQVSKDELRTTGEKLRQSFQTQS